MSFRSHQTTQFAPAARVKRKSRIATLTVSLALVAVAMFSAQSFAAGTDELLDAEAAFKVSAKMKDSKTIELHYTIADGYYMYRNRFKVAASADSAKLKNAIMPTGKIKQDATFGRVETYRKSLHVLVPLLPLAPSSQAAAKGASQPIKFKVTSQGCADVGVCYPPQHHEFELNVQSRASVSPLAENTVATAKIANPAGATESGSATSGSATTISDLIRKAP